MPTSSNSYELERQFANWLTEARFEANITLETLSTETGIPCRTLKSLEMGLEPMSAASLLLIEGALGCGLPVFLRGEGITPRVTDSPSPQEQESQFEACMNMLLTLSQRAALDKAHALLSIACDSTEVSKANVTKLRA